jgi:hypothetical protein
MFPLIGVSPVRDCFRVLEVFGSTSDILSGQSAVIKLLELVAVVIVNGISVV